GPSDLRQVHVLAREHTVLHETLHQAPGRLKRTGLALKYKDYYAALGVARDADADTIRKAYRKLARQHHPDVSGAPQAEDRFKEVAEAYATLKDPEKRAAYDSLGARRSGEEFGPPPGWAS